MTWLSVETLLILSVLHDIEARFIDFTLEFPQADLDVDIYMELPQEFDIRRITGSHVIKLNTSLYGLCQSSHS